MEQTDRNTHERLVTTCSDHLDPTLEARWAHETRAPADASQTSRRGGETAPTLSVLWACSELGSWVIFDLHDSERNRDLDHPLMTFIYRPQIGRDYPLNLSILIGGGKETNKDSLSSGERTGRSPARNPACET